MLAAMAPGGALAGRAFRWIAVALMAAVGAPSLGALALHAALPVAAMLQQQALALALNLAPGLARRAPGRTLARAPGRALSRGDDARRCAARGKARLAGAAARRARRHVRGTGRAIQPPRLSTISADVSASPRPRSISSA